MQLFDALLQYTSDAVMLTDLEGRIQRVNPGFTLITGYTPREALDRTPALLHSGRHGEAFYQTLWQNLDQRGYWQGKIWNRRKNGEVYPCWQTIVRITDAETRPTHYLGVASDTPQHRGDLGLARYQAANYDPLTGLPNDFMLDDKMLLAQALAKRHNLRFAVLHLEMNGFQAVNELLGRTVGDHLLREIAERIRNRVREIDTVARLSGEQFVVVITEIKQVEDITKLAHTILRWLEMPFSIGGHTVSVSPAMGIAVFPEDHTDPKTLIQLAEEAMQRAKITGRAYLCFYNQDTQQT